MDTFKLFEISEASFKENYQLGKNIGMGSFGYVVLATNKHDCNEYAVKYTKLDNQTCELRERNNLCTLKHENIVKFFNYFIADTTSGKSCVVELFISIKFCRNVVLMVESCKL